MTINDSLSIRKIGDEIFIFDRKLSRIHSFNKVGSIIWERIKENVDTESIVDSLTKHFEIDRETARKDLNEFIDELKNKKIITAQNS